MAISANAALTSSYNYGDVTRSVFISIASSYAALDLAGRVIATSGRIRLAWMVGGATVIGIGIWATHFEGMLALHLPISVEYDWPTVLVSFVVAVLASGIMLYGAGRQKTSLMDTLIGSILAAAGIIGVHDVGLAAMRLPALTQFSLPLETLSVLFAILFASLVLRLPFYLREEARGTPGWRLGGATMMGLSLSAMHYTGMAATSFIPSAFVPDLSHATVVSALGDTGIAAVALLVLGAVILTSAEDWSRVIQRPTSSSAQDGAARVLATASDITELKGGEVRLREYEKVVEGLEELVAVVDREYRYVLANRAFLHYKGLQRAELLGRSVSEVWNGGVFESVVKEKLDECFRGKAVSYEMKYRHPQLAERELLVSHFPIEGGNGIDRAACVLRDVTERKRVEESLQEAQAELAHITRVVTMGELVASIAHEVNQPLTGIVTTSNVALRQMEGGVPNLVVVHEAISEIAEDATRISDIISRIRALLKKDAPDQAELNISHVIREAAILVSNEAARNDVQVRLDLAINLPVVLGDRVQLQQVLINLAMNGIDAMRTVVGRPRQLVIKSSKYANGVLIQVQDSGIGLDPDRIDRIFEPFFTTKAQGIGMGLSISRSIIESHGGRLWAEPCSYGAIFQITLPANRDSAS